jgi:hypothetical protein
VAGGREIVGRITTADASFFPYAGSMASRRSIPLQWIAPTRRQAGWRLHLSRSDRVRPICGSPLETGEVVTSVATETDAAICFGCYVGARGERGEMGPLLHRENLGILRVESGCSHGPTTIVYVVPSERSGFQQLLDRDCGCDCEMCESRRAERPRLALIE